TLAAMDELRLDIPEGGEHVRLLHSSLRFTHCERRQVVTDQHCGRFPKTSGRPRRRSVLRRRPVGALPPPYYEAPRRWLGPRTSPRIPAVQVPPTPPRGDTRPHRAARHLRPTRLGT